MAGARHGATNGRMFARIILKSMKVRRSRVSIAFLSIAIGAVIVAALSSVYFDISTKMSRELRAYGANLFIGPKDRVAGRALPLSEFEQALAVIPPARLVGATPYLYGVVRLGTDDAVLAGVDFAGLRRLSPYWQVDGDWIAVDFDGGSCMIGKSLAEEKGLKVGDSINVLKDETGFQRRLKIKGIMETGQAEDRQVFVNLELAGRILGREGRANHAMASVVAGGYDIDALASRLRARFPDLQAEPIRRISYSEGRILGKIKGLMALVALVVLAVTTLCVMTTLIAVIAERTPEIGLMKAIGADDRAVAVQFLSETLVIALAASGAGLALGFGLAQLLGRAVFGSAISLRAAVPPMTLGLSLLASLIAAALPVRMAVRIAPAQVLKGE